ncbi:MAG TPA: polysaccharide deacetylase family protein [Gemmatimonadaceae bacterium]|nr:polysaccharide deacetylase family protein [Gemmatimonadaceae bacterium]
MKLVPGGRAIAIMYHDVVTGEPASSGFAGPGADIYKLERDEFGAHLDGLRVAPSTVDGGGLATRAKPESAWPVFLTFDDGGVSAHTHVAPLLEARGWRGIFFITTDRIGTRGFLDAEQIRDLARRGHVIGSHSCSHPRRISDCSGDELRHEWADSVAILSEILRAPVETASVPGGFYSAAVGAAASRAGIRVLFTSEPTMRIASIEDCILIGRYGVWRGMPTAITGRIAAGERAPRWRQSAWWTIKKAAKSIPGDPYAKVRGLLLARRA